MKIHIVGNILNLSFIFGKFLKMKGLDVKVFIDRKLPEYFKPQWEEPQLKQFPEWVEMIDVDYKKMFFGRNEKKYIKLLQDCDIIHAIGEDAIWAHRTKKPYIFLSYGCDLEILPFNKGSVKNMIFSNILRKALKGADRVLYAMPQQDTAVEKLRLSNASFFPYTYPIDFSVYRKFSEDERRKVRSKYNADFIFFHPARQEWTCSDENNKGNNKLFQAFARFTRDSKKKTMLIAVEKGRDLDKSKALTEKLGITNYVKWIKPLHKRAMIDLLNITDICFDNFHYGFYGIAALESLSLGVPTCLYLDTVNAGGCSMPPVINANLTDEIYTNMIELTSNPVRLGELGSSSREWMIRHYRWEDVIDRYIKLYKEVIKK